MIKKEIRVLGIASSTPQAKRGVPTQVVGVVYRGNRWLEGVMRAPVPPSVVDLAPNIANMVTRSPHFPQLRVIVLDELITKSGSFVDIESLSAKTRLPVIAVLRQRTPTRRPSKSGAKFSRKVYREFARLPCRKWKAGTRTFSVYYAGLGKIDLDELLEVCASREGLPEAVRVARLTASSVGKLLVRCSA
mgnify:CR=1 FL=1